MWGLYIIVFFGIIFAFSFVSQIFLGKFWPGIVTGFIIDIPIYIWFVKYLRRRKGI